MALRLPTRLPTRPAPPPAEPPGTAAVVATLALLAFGANMASPLYPGYQAAFGFGDLTLTVVYATYALVSVPALLVLGPAADRLGARRLLRAGLLLGALGSACFAVAQGPAWLLVGRVAQGLALGAATGAGMATLAARVTPRRAGTLGATAFVGGTAAGPAVTGLVAQYGGSSPLGFLLHVAALALVWGPLRALPSPHPAPSSPARAPLWTRPRLPAQGRRAFLAAAASGAVSWTVVGLFLGLVPTVVAREADTRDLAVLGAVVGVVLGVAVLAQTAVPRLGAHLSQRLGLTLLAGSLVVLATTGAAAGLGALAACALLAGLGHGLAYGGAHHAVARAGDRDPDHAAGLNATAYVAFYLGAGLPAVVVGLLTVATTLPTAVTVLAVATLLAAAGAAVLGHRPAGTPAGAGCGNCGACGRG